MNFVEAQAQYYAQCHAYMAELQKQLARYNATHFFFNVLTQGKGFSPFLGNWLRQWGLEVSISYL